MLMGNHNGTIPENGHKGPRQRSRDDGRVDEARVGIVAEIQRREVDKVEDDDELGPAKVAADKEHDKGKVQQIVEDKVAPDAGSGVANVCVFGKEVHDVAKLEDKEADPG